MSGGVSTDNFDPVELAKEVLVNGAGGTGRQGIDKFALQIAASGPLADRFASLEELGREVRPTYPNVAAGIEATVVGQQFKVQTDDPDNVAYYDYSHEVGGVATLVGTVPSAQALGEKANKSDGYAAGPVASFPQILSGGENKVELLGFSKEPDEAGAVILRIARRVVPHLVSLLSSYLPGSDRASFPSLRGAGNVELLGFERNGGLRAEPSTDFVRKVFAGAKGRIPASAAGITPVRDIAIWGTSLSARTGSAAHGYAATSVQARLAIELQRDVFNGAVGGTNSYAIAIRQGGRPMPLTLQGNMLPADTSAVTVTDWGGHDAYNNQTLQFRAVTLLGIPCVLTRIPDPATPATSIGWTIARLDPAQAATPIPPATPVIFDDAVANVSRTHIIEPTRNDAPSTRAQILATRDNTLLMTGYAAKGAADPRSLIIGPWPATGEYIGATGRTHNERRRAEMKLTFGPNYVDLWDYMVDHAIFDLGITPTPDDAQDMLNGIVPRSLMDDTVHPNGAGNTAIARAIARQIIARGY